MTLLKTATTWPDKRGLGLIAAILFALPFERIPSLHWQQPWPMTIRISQILGAILIIWLLPVLYRNWRQFIRWPWLALILFIGCCIIASVTGIDPTRSLRVTGYYFFVSLLAATVSTVTQRHGISVRWLKALTAGALIACVFGFYQFFGDVFGLPEHLTGLRPQYTKALLGFPRLQATALEPLYFGDFLLIPISLLLTRVVSYQRYWKRSIIAATIMMVGLWLTVSRGAMVALLLILGIITVVGLCRRHWFRAAAVIGTASGSVALAVGIIYLATHYTPHQIDQSSHAVSNFSQQTININHGESAIGRTETRDLALTALSLHPWLGVGPGAFGDFAHARNPERYYDNRTIVNNEPFELLAETGILGSVAIAGFVITLLYSAMRAIPRLNTQDKVWLVGLIIAMLGIIAQYQTFSTLYITHVWIVIGLIAGLSVRLDISRRDMKRESQIA